MVPQIVISLLFIRDKSLNYPTNGDQFRSYHRYLFIDAIGLLAPVLDSETLGREAKKSNL